MIPSDLSREEWLSCRIGKVTASRMADLMATLGPPGVYHVEPRDNGKFAVIREGATRATKVLPSKQAADKYAEKCATPEWGASRATYMAELIVERLTGAQADGYISASMQWGIDTEDQAIRTYEFIVGAEVTPSPFVDHPRIAMSGASPDGLVGNDGLIEVKCPDTKTHIETLLAPKIPDKYIKQTQWQMSCTDRQWCDWVSFDPRLPVDLQLYRQRIERDDSMIKDLEQAVTDFLAELDDKLAKLNELRGSPT